MPGSELYEQFMALHAREGGFVMPNAGLYTRLERKESILFFQLLPGRPRRT